jgi:hypothetical protein
MEHYTDLHPNWWTLKPNERRTLRQQQLFDSWVKQKAQGYLTAVTGLTIS